MDKDSPLDAFMRLDPSKGDVLFLYPFNDDEPVGRIIDHINDDETVIHFTNGGSVLMSFVLACRYTVLYRLGTHIAFQFVSGRGSRSAVGTVIGYDIVGTTVKEARMKVAFIDAFWDATLGDNALMYVANEVFITRKDVERAF